MYFYCTQIIKMKKLQRLLVFAVCGLLFIGFTSCGGSDTKTASGKKDKYEEAKEDLGETEKKNPVRFLTAFVKKDKKNLWGQTVVKGALKNNATVASYKDVEIELSFFSKTGALIGKENETIYEILTPGKEADFKTKYFAPKETDSVALRVVSAKSE